MAYMNMMINIPWIFLFIQILVLVSKSETKVSAIIAFGDSFVDSGNNNYIPTLLKSNFPPNGRDFPGGIPTGRSCNGRLHSDFGIINLEDPVKCNEKYNLATLEFNGKLKVLVAKLNKELPGLKLFFADPYNLLLQLIQRPSEFGFEVSAKGCCGTELFETSILSNKFDPFTCKDANKYVFGIPSIPQREPTKFSQIISFQASKHSFYDFSSKYTRASMFRFM